MSHFGNIGHHLVVAIVDHIPNGWVMWKMGTWLMTHVFNRKIYWSLAQVAGCFQGQPFAGPHGNGQKRWEDHHAVWKPVAGWMGARYGQMISPNKPFKETNWSDSEASNSLKRHQSRRGINIRAVHVSMWQFVYKKMGYTLSRFPNHWNDENDGYPISMHIPWNSNSHFPRADWKNGGYPLVNIQKTMDNHSFSWVNMGKSTISIANVQ